MDAQSVLDAVQKIGIPVVILGTGLVAIWRVGGKLLAALVASYREQIAALTADRDHFRTRSEQAEDRTDALCRELIDEARGRPVTALPRDGGAP